MRRRATTQVAVVALISLTILALPGCKRRKPPVVPKTEPHLTAEPTPPSTSSPEEHASAGREVYAAWYDVPIWSLAKKRAGLEELTAAHNTLPLGTRVRLTHLANGKSVVVRITDRGIHDRKVKIDVCKEAAVELGMLDKGIARVRMQILSDAAPASGAPAPTTVADE